MSKKTPSGIDQYWHKPGICGIFTRAALRTLQFVLAIIVAGLYGVDLAYATKTNTHARSEWIYAEFVSAVSAITCIIHCFVTVVHVAWSTWDGVLFVLWLAQVGVFGTTFVSDTSVDDDKFTTSVSRMRAAVWINLVNMVLWLVTFVLGVAWCIRTRKVTRRTDQLDFGEGNLMVKEMDEEVGARIDLERGEKQASKDHCQKKEPVSRQSEETSEAGSIMKMEKN